MSPRRTRRGTVRESVSEISVDSTIKSTKKTRKTRQIDQSKILKSSEEDSDNQGDLSVSVLNSTSKTTLRKRRNKQELLENDILSESVDETRSAQKQKNDSKVTKSRRQKNNKSQVANANSLISEDESFDTKVQKVTRQASSKSRIDNSEVTLEEPSVKKRNVSKVTPMKSDSKLSKTSNRKLPKVETPDNNITPENSPISIPHTPSRTTKTPRKSPINIGSPKTHSRMSLKSLKVPRKLSISDSPSSDTIDEPLPQKANSSKITNESLSKSPKLKSVPQKKKSMTPKLKTSPRVSKASKSVLKTPKSKTPKVNKKSPSTNASAKAKKLEKVDSEQNSKNDSDTSLTLVSEIKQENTVSNNTESISPEKSADLPNDTTTLISDKSSENPKKSSIKKSFNESQNTSLLNSSKKLSVSFSSKSLEASSNTSSQLSTSKSKTPKSLSSVSSKKSPKFVSSFTPGKTPKIAFAPKSKKKSPKLKKTPLKSPKLKNSPSKSPTLNKTSSNTPDLQETPEFKQEKESIQEIINKSIDNMNLSKTLSMSPRVLVNKLTSPEYNPINSSVKKTSPNKSFTLVNGTAQPETSKSPKASIIKSKNIESSKLKDKSLVNGRSGVRKSTTGISRKSITISKSATPSIASHKRFSNLKPLTSSTPREKLKQNQLNKSLNSKAKITRRLNHQSTIENSPALLEDVSAPFIDDSSLIPMSAVFDSDNSQNDITFGADKNDTFNSKDKIDKDGTYEVAEPKTPKFQKQVIKRKLEENNSKVNDENDRKRSFKVHFASPARARGQSSGISRLGTPGHAIQKKKVSMAASEHQTSLRNRSLANKGESGTKTMSTPLRTPKNPVLKKQPSITSTAAPQSATKTHENQLSSLSSISKLKPVVRLEKRIETKTPSGKIPNFAEIHKKNFAKMESLVDLKKRVEERHVTLNTAPSSSQKSQSKRPAEAENAKNGDYNRFGFKVRKNEAISMISKKQSGNVESREKKREDARSVLKGVRMNRRFELQMKSRMRNS